MTEQQHEWLMVLVQLVPTVWIAAAVANRFKPGVVQGTTRRIWHTLFHVLVIAPVAWFEVKALFLLGWYANDPASVTKAEAMSTVIWLTRFTRLQVTVLVGAFLYRQLSRVWGWEEGLESD